MAAEAENAAAAAAALVKENAVVEGMELRVRSLEEEGTPQVSLQPLASDADEETNVAKRRRIEPDDKQEAAAAGGRRYKKRKVALFVSYCGFGYQGMQKNVGAKTIEGDLEEALFRAGAIAESTYGDPRKIDWARAARTDKGVSAVGQVVSGRFFIDPPGLVERVNNHLAEQIRVLGFKRVTGGFNAKKLCDRRKYEYVLPLFCLDPSSHECKVAVHSSRKENESAEVEPKQQQADGTVEEAPEDAKSFSCPCEERPFTFGDEERSKMNRVLGYYVGTHNFHNYTCRIKPEDPSTQRYILSFQAGDVFTINGKDFLRCTVVGQSFMLHQIRKMIGHAVAVMRGAPESLIATAFSRDVKINVPMAPELGLFLDECLYSAYNQRYAGSHEEISLRDFAKENAEFKDRVIYPHIATTDSRDGVFARWLHGVTGERYPEVFKEAQS